KESPTFGLTRPPWITPAVAEAAALAAPVKPLETLLKRLPNCGGRVTAMVGYSSRENCSGRASVEQGSIHTLSHFTFQETQRPMSGGPNSGRCGGMSARTPPVLTSDDRCQHARTNRTAARLIPRKNRTLRGTAGRSCPAVVHPGPGGPRRPYPWIRASAP